MSEDLYSILGVSKSASDAEIKRAYKKKARQYHPDVNKESGAEDMFKKVQQAYSVLSDSSKRTSYDRFGVVDDAPGSSGFGNFGGFGGFGQMEDIFDTFFGRSGASGGRRQASQSTSGTDLRYDLEISLEDAVSGLKKAISVYHYEACEPCSGSGSKTGEFKTCSKCHGTGEIQVTQRTFIGSITQVSTCPDCLGRGKTVKDPCSNCQGKGIEKKRKKIEVDVPPGVGDDMRLQVRGEGNAGENGGKAGDLYIFISVKPHRYFKREGDDLYIELDVSYLDLILGATIDVPTILGAAKLTILEGTPSGARFKLKNKGVPNVRNKAIKGDLYVIVNVVIPKKVTQEEKDILNKLKDVSKTHAGEIKETLFDRVKKWF